MLARLKYFYQVASSGSFSRAAEELFISQPALSRQIAALEEDVGLPLFSRQGRKPVLTDAGRRLFNYAEKIMELNREAKKEISELKNLTSGEVIIGASTTIANYLLPPVLADYHHRHPEIKIFLNVGNSEDIEQDVLNNRVDLGFIGSSVQSPRLFQEQFAEDELFLVVSQNHHFAKINRDVFPSHLAEETFLYREAGSDTRRLFNIFLKEMEVKPSSVVTLGHTEAIKSGIINNLGISFLSKHTWQNELKLGLLVPLEKYIK